MLPPSLEISVRAGQTLRLGERAGVSQGSRNEDSSVSCFSPCFQCLARDTFQLLYPPSIKKN